MSRAPAPRRARAPNRSGDIAARRRQLARARRQLEAFDTANRYQAELKGTALAMIAYLEDRWRVPGWATDVDRWWHILGRYAAVLVSGDLAGPGARRRLEQVLNENQVRPMDLSDPWLIPYRYKARSRPRLVRPPC